MTHQPTAQDFSANPAATRIAELAAAIGHDIVDLDGFLDAVRNRARNASSVIDALDDNVSVLQQSKQSVQDGLKTLLLEAAKTEDATANAVIRLRENASEAEKLAAWVQNLEERMNQVFDGLSQVYSNTDRIAEISKQINMLAINARIEAVRAGTAGRGFGVVAEAINSLAMKTSHATDGIAASVEQLNGWISSVSEETGSQSRNAANILKRQSDLNGHLDALSESAHTTRVCSDLLSQETRQSADAIDNFIPVYHDMNTANQATLSDVEQAADRTAKLIDFGEEILLQAIESGGNTIDTRMIRQVQRDASRMANRLAEAVDQGRITMDDLFSDAYTAIEGSNPPQFMAPFTFLTDDLFRDIQEEALRSDDSIVFCAAVDRNGYLPTHNVKFSQPQGSDTVANEANSRNRRMFNDRVGLKSGRNTQPFLVQVYRRRMGGGEFVMMKDTSAPIVVKGRHWGGLRLAYRF